MLSMPCERRLAVRACRTFLNLVSRHVLAAIIRVGVRLNHALIEQLVERFRRADKAQIVQDLVPEARIQQVQHRVLHAADVQVDAAGFTRGLVVVRAHPIVELVGLHHVLGVFGVDVAHVIPAGASPIRHRVRVAMVLLGALAQVEGDIHPIVVTAQRCLRIGFRILRVEGLRAVVRHVRQVDRQHAVRQQVRDLILVVDDRERLAPVALAAEQPVTQTVADRALADAGGFQPADDLVNRLIHAQAIQ